MNRNKICLRLGKACATKFNSKVEIDVNQT